MRHARTGHVALMGVVQGNALTGGEVERGDEQVHQLYRQQVQAEHEREADTDQRCRRSCRGGRRVAREMMR